ncbi:zinc finger protein 644 [Solea solea]|uniref:zinc finger protein 644 n=1 Tax=Solea solea TaxID=90069 RepID=UPI00272A36F4|nr:zinc finger protein 644 [Solea solea]XP_058493392.1 zinc finger protein 644 [Solea solea]
MSDVKPQNAREDKDVASMSDRPGHTQEPLQSHTFCLKNNAAGPSSEEHENPLNGTQLIPFVYSSVPAVPQAGNSLPSGALVNGPASHPTSEVHHVLNKGAASSNNVPGAAWQEGKNMSPEVLPPPSELQSDAWKNTVGPTVKTPATQPCVNTPPSHSKKNESKLACSAPSGDSVEQTHVSIPHTKETIEMRSQRSVCCPEISSDDYGDAEVIRWDSTRDWVLHSGEKQGSGVKQHSSHVKSMWGSEEKVNNSLNHTCSRNDAPNVDNAHKDDSVVAQCGIKYSALPFRNHSWNMVLEREHCVCSEAQRGCNDENDPEHKEGVSQEVEQLKTEQLHPSFFSCTMCDINFKEKTHFHRHMMYHLGKHNQVKSEAFICRECGRLFCDRNSLMRHIIIHRDKLQLMKLMEEIKGLRNVESEGGGTTALCPHPASVCSRPKILVQHAATRNNVKHYYFCEECDYVTLTQQALKLHLHVTHRTQDTTTVHASDAEKAAHVQFQCKMGILQSQQSHQPGAEAFFSKRFSGKEETSTVHSPQVKLQISCNKRAPSPYLWRISRHGNLCLRPGDNLDVPTDLTCAVEKDDAERNGCEIFGSSAQRNRAETGVVLPSSPSLELDQVSCEGSTEGRVNQKSLSMRNMSTLLQSSIDKVKGCVFPGFSQRQRKHSTVRELEKGCEGGRNFSDESEGNPYDQRCSRKRQRFSPEDQRTHFLSSQDDEAEDCSDIEQLVIKEEFLETSVCENPQESPYVSKRDSFGVSSSQVLKHKRCPYCPAMFESGVGLSNHMRGHLHRAGLNYNARHMVSPEQVVLQDHRLRTRRRTRTAMRKTRKAMKPETRGKHMCPLYCGQFDTKTGLSNHVRGHLKKIGRSVSSTTKSPLCILNGLLLDKKEHENILRVLKKDRAPASQKISSSTSSLDVMHAVLPVTIQCEMKRPQATGGGFVPNHEVQTFTEKMQCQTEAHRGIKASSSTLAKLLKTRRELMELPTRSSQKECAARKLCSVTQDYKEETTSVEQNDIQGEPRQICLQCKSSFPAAVGLSARLHGDSSRKRFALFEDSGYDRKQERLRPEQKQSSPSFNAQMYTLTCRFCDLVFEGPLSIQEDWIRHLQRHLLHNSVPHSGTSMVEVLESWSKNTCKHV